MASARECWSGCEVALIADLLIDGITSNAQSYSRGVNHWFSPVELVSRRSLDPPGLLLARYNRVLKIDRLACQIDRGADASPLWQVANTPSRVA
jgi:hypothetical protein